MGDDIDRDYRDSLQAMRQQYGIRIGHAPQTDSDTWIETHAEQFILAHCQCTERKRCQFHGLERDLAELVRKSFEAGRALSQGKTT